VNEAVTDIIVSRSRAADRLSSTVLWSFAAHVIVVGAVLLVQRTTPDPPPRTIMTISLGGAVGPKTPGLNQIGSRAVQAPQPQEPVKRAETAPAPTPPKMALPDPKSRTRPERARPQQAPQEATGKTETTGAKPQEGTTKADTQNRGQGFGLSSGGGAGDGITTDVTNFCCPEYIIDMRDRIRRNWNGRQGIVGTATMRFTIQRDGTITDVQRERSSGFEVLDAQAERAVRQTIRFAPLPDRFPNQTLTVYMPFDYYQ
jgi:TonB family protein